MTTPAEDNPWESYEPAYPGVLTSVSDPDNAYFIIEMPPSADNPVDDGPLDSDGLTDAEYDAIFKTPAAERNDALIAAGWNTDADVTESTVELQSRMDPDLKKYWLHGEGAAKIRWGTEGSFTRCVKAMREHVPVGTEGVCANLYHEATGHWPGEKRRK